MPFPCSSPPNPTTEQPPPGPAKKRCCKGKRLNKWWSLQGRGPGPQPGRPKTQRQVPDMQPEAGSKGKMPSSAPPLLFPQLQQSVCQEGTETRASSEKRRGRSPEHGEATGAQEESYGLWGLRGPWPGPLPDGRWEGKTCDGCDSTLPYLVALKPLNNPTPWQGTRFLAPKPHRSLRVGICCHKGHGERAAPRCPILVPP